MPPTTKRSTAKDGAARDIELANANATCARALGGSRKTWMNGTGWSSNPSQKNNSPRLHSDSTRRPGSRHTPANPSNSYPEARKSSTRDLVRDPSCCCSTPELSHGLVSWAYSAWQCTLNISPTRPWDTTKICLTRHNVALRSPEGLNADLNSIKSRTLRICPNHRHLRMFCPRLLQAKNIAMTPSALSILRMRTRHYRTVGECLWRTKLRKYV